MLKEGEHEEAEEYIWENCKWYDGKPLYDKK